MHEAIATSHPAVLPSSVTAEGQVTLRSPQPPRGSKAVVRTMVRNPPVEHAKLGCPVFPISTVPLMYEVLIWEGAWSVCSVVHASVTLLSPAVDQSSPSCMRRTERALCQ